ncbi:MAG: hypothetical protein FWB72_03680, partial [Firmicutes bacterium]|nr:hypothetical protein [Bacillota bacterium]
TVNVVTKESGAKFVLQGGSITAGLTKYIDALNFTPELANIIKGQTEDFWLSLPKTAIGKCTLSNLHSGIYFGYVGMVAQLLIQTLTEMRREHNINSATIILTGGASKNLHLNVKAAMLAAMWDDNEPENLDLQKTAKHTPKNAKPAKNAKTKITPKILQNDNLIHNALFKLSQHLQ